MSLRWHYDRMLLPVSDAPNPRGTPIATWTLIALNIAVYLFVSLPLSIQPADTADPAFAEYLDFLSQQIGDRRQLAAAASRITAYDLVVFTYGFRPAAPSGVDLLASLFLHGGLLHLVGNMLFLWIYGDNVEHRLGPSGFVLWYLLTGVAATLFHSLFFLDSGVPLVGASGAISGVLGFYFIWFPRNTVRLLFFFPPFFWDVFELPARIVLGVYLVLDNILPFVFAGPGGVAYGAHIGGFIAGAAAAMVMTRTARRARAAEVGRAPRAVSTSALGEALRHGRIEEAASEYFSLPAAAARQALDPHQALALARRLRSAGHSAAALALVQRAIGLASNGADLAELHALAGLILLEEHRDPTAAYQHLITAARLGPTRKTALEITAALDRIEAAQRFHPRRRR